MRVISGTARGTKLNSIDEMSTRPTLDRVKESLFNIIQQRIDESVVLDIVLLIALTSINGTGR